MARIRTIKPEFWSDEKMALLDTQTRLVFLGLISMADDYGRLIDNMKSLDGMIFPFTDESCADSLNTLQKLSRILRYRSKAGQQLIQIINWNNHQKVNHPGKEILPSPSKEDWLSPATDKKVASAIKAPRKRTARESKETGKKPSRTISTTNDLGPTISTSTVSAPSSSTPAADELLEAVNVTHIADEPPTEPPAVKKTWVQEGAEDWKLLVGPIPEPRFGAALKPAVDLDGWDVVRPVMHFYCAEELKKSKTRKIEWFAADYQGWKQRSKPKLMGVGGILSKEELKELERAS